MTPEADPSPAGTKTPDPCCGVPTMVGAPLLCSPPHNTSFQNQAISNKGGKSRTKVGCPHDETMASRESGAVYSPKETKPPPKKDYPAAEPASNSHPIDS